MSSRDHPHHGLVEVKCVSQVAWLSRCKSGIAIIASKARRRGTEESEHTGWPACRRALACFVIFKSSAAQWPQLDKDTFFSLPDVMTTAEQRAQTDPAEQL